MPRTYGPHLPEAATATETADPIPRTLAEFAYAEGRVPDAHDMAEETGARAESPSDLAYATPEIAATPDAMGGHMVKRMNQLNRQDAADGFGLGGSDVGVHYAHNYERWYSDRWKEEYRYGHQGSGKFVQPYEANAFMTFQLKEGQSASEGIQDWLKGLTIAECLTSVLAIELETVRATVGNKKFDFMFGSSDPAVDKAVTDRGSRLMVSPRGSSARAFQQATELANMADRGEAITEEQKDKLLKPGDWYYFYNYSTYLLKHPGGAWQGENALYMGKDDAGQRLWSGFGASNVSDEHMEDQMVSSYNQSRTARDEKVLDDRGLRNPDGTYSDKAYDPTSGVFPERITRAELKSDPGYTFPGRGPRKAGFLAQAGSELNTTMLQQIVKTPESAL
jgi:hypothetical protein